MRAMIPYKVTLVVSHLGRAQPLDGRLLVECKAADLFEAVDYACNTVRSAGGTVESIENIIAVRG